MIWRVLDVILLVTIVVGPWVFLTYALSRFRDILQRDWRILVLLVAVLWLFLTILLPPLTETPVQAILHSTTKPWFSAYVQSVLNGHAPLWLPQLGTGLPALANPYVGFMSPFTGLLLFFADVDQGVNVLVLAHLVFAGFGAYLLARSVGLGRAAALLIVLPTIWNPWVFRRLSTEVHALYLFGFAWLPLTWALLLRFIRTRAFGDAIATGIPLAFMAVSMPTVLAQTIFAVEFFLAVAAIVELVRRRWAALARLAAGSVLLVFSSFLAAAPEHLAARELFQVTADTRFIPSKITGGWRERDFSVQEFVRLLLPNRLGARIVPLSYSVDAFGVPFSPGDAVVAIAALGAASTLVPRFRRAPHVAPGWPAPTVRRWRPVLLPHILLFLVLASVATHGPAYGPVRWVDPLWGFAGNFPVVGALLLMIIVIGFGVGLEVIARVLTMGARIPRAALASRLGPTAAQVISSPRPWNVGIKLLLTAGASLVVVELLWGVRTFFRTPPTDPDGRPDLRFNVPTMPIGDLAKLPHLAFLASQTRNAELPSRIYCSGDRPVWPSPCFDYAVNRARTEAVWTGELAWAMPRWQWSVFTELSSASDGTIQPLLERLLQLASVEYLVHPRDLPYPVLARVRWDPSPGNFELFGRFLGSSIGGGIWPDAWDGEIRIHRFPGHPRVFFANAAAIPGDEGDRDAVVRAILADPAFDPRQVILLHGDSPDASNIPVLPAEVVETARAGSASSVPGLVKRAPNAKLRVQSPRSGAWMVEGYAPRAGALLFSQMFYPGLRATVNGRPVPVHRADLFLSALPVPKGEFRATLEYAPRAILASNLLTAAFATFLGFLALRRRRPNVKLSKSIEV